MEYGLAGHGILAHQIRNLEHSNLEHQIQNDEIWIAKSGEPTCRTVLLDEIAKLNIIKQGASNLEKYMWTMWTAPIKKNK